MLNRPRHTRKFSGRRRQFLVWFTSAIIPLVFVHAAFLSEVSSAPTASEWFVCFVFDLQNYQLWTRWLASSRKLTGKWVSHLGSNPDPDLRSTWCLCKSYFLANVMSQTSQTKGRDFPTWPAKWSCRLRDQANDFPERTIGGTIIRSFPKEHLLREWQIFDTS